MPPTKHAKLGASGATRWRNCPGSINHCEGLPDVTTVYAAEGTVAHGIGERRILGKGVCLVGDVVQEDGFNIEITQEMFDAVQVYVDYVSERAEGNTLFIEKQFNLAPLNPPDEMYGTTDASIWDEEVKFLEVIDYKHGAGVAVDAINNDQGFIYALGAVVELGKKPEKIRVTIVQPRAHHDDGIIRSWDFTWEELIEGKKSLFADAEKTLDPDAELVAGSWCRFCKGHATCPAQKAQVVALAQDAFAVEPTFPDLDDMSIVDIAEVMTKGPAVLAWIKSVGVHALGMLERGEEVPGFKLVETRTNRAWVDEEKTEKYFKGRRFKTSEKYNRKLISPAQAEKLIKLKGGVPLPDRLVTKPEGRAALAPLSDKRPEISSGVEAFGVLVETTEEE